MRPTGLISVATVSVIMNIFRCIQPEMVTSAHGGPQSASPLVFKRKSQFLCIHPFSSLLLCSSVTLLSLHCFPSSSRKVFGSIFWSFNTTSLPRPIKLVHTHTNTQCCWLVPSISLFYLWDAADKWQCCSSANPPSPALQGVCACARCWRRKEIVEGHGETGVVG